MVKNFYDISKNLILITVGALIYAFALEGFLVPNNIIDGGIIGISIMADYLIPQVSLGVFIVVLNLPFMFLAYQKFGKRFVLNTFCGVITVAIFVTMVEHLIAKFNNGMPITSDSILATVFGGVLLGLGVGLILRNSGALDGTEIMAIRLAKKFGFSVGEIIMGFNLFIFTAAGFVFEPNRAMYSIIAYFIAYKVIDLVLEGLNESKSAWIVSSISEQIGRAIMKEMDVSVTYIDAIGGYSGEPKRIVYCVVSRLELTKLKQLVKTTDPSAFIAIENVHEVEGVRFTKGKRRKAKKKDAVKREKDRKGI